MRDYQAWFNALYLRHAKKMVYIVYRTLKDWELSKDIVGDTFTLLLARGESMMAHENPDGWLYRTMRNLVGNELQKAARSREVPLIAEEVGALGRPDTYFPSEPYFPAGLSAEECKILQLQMVEELSYEEIALQLGKSTSACRTRVCRARANYKKLLLLEQKNKNSGNKTPGSTNIKDRRCKDARHS